MSAPVFQKLLDLIEMTPEEKQKINQEVLSKIVLACKMEGVDYLKLDKQTQDLMIVAFQVGIAYWQLKLEEARDKMILEQDIPF